MAADPPRARPDRKERMRLAVAAALGIAATLFAVLNLDDVDVNWIVGTWSTPLIVVIVVSFLLGVGVDRAIAYRKRRRAAKSA
jgi:uncharacterized integral membrane protein